MGTFALTWVESFAYSVLSAAIQVLAASGVPNMSASRVTSAAMVLGVFSSCTGTSLPWPPAASLSLAAKPSNSAYTM